MGLIIDGVQYCRFAFISTQNARALLYEIAELKAWQEKEPKFVTIKPVNQPLLSQSGKEARELQILETQ